LIIKHLRQRHIGGGSPSAALDLLVWSQILRTRAAAFRGADGFVREVLWHALLHHLPDLVTSLLSGLLRGVKNDPD
jgi:hypothetical protein